MKPTLPLMKLYKDDEEIKSKLMTNEKYMSVLERQRNKV